MASNNNIAGVMHGGRLYLAWRTAPLHFAGHQTRLQLVSSPDMGGSWDWEASLYLGTDLREPMFLSINDTLYFSFFQAGTNPVDFEPLGLYRMENLAVGVWTGPEKYGHEGEVVWEIVKVTQTRLIIRNFLVIIFRRMEPLTARATLVSTGCRGTGQTWASSTCSSTSPRTASPGSRPAPATSPTTGASQRSASVLICRSGHHTFKSFHRDHFCPGKYMGSGKERGRRRIRLGVKNILCKS